MAVETDNAHVELLERWPQGRHSLGWRLVIVTLGFCFFFTLVTVGVRTWAVWHEHVQQMDIELGLIEQVYRRTLTKAVWDMDQDAVEAHLDSAVHIESVARVQLTVLSAQHIPVVQVRSRTGWVDSNLAPVRRVPLVFSPYAGSKETVGELILYGNEDLLWSEMKSVVVAIVGFQLLQSILLAGLIILMFSRLVTVHIRRIALHLTELTPERLDLPLRLSRSAKREDELTLLVQGINQLQSNLSGYLGRQHMYEKELAAHRDQLAERVQVRTAELQSLTEAQQMVLLLSNRLIRAPYERLELYQQSCLSEVAQRLGACYALWYVREESGIYFRLAMHWRCETCIAPESQINAAQLAHLDVLLDQGGPVTFTSGKALSEVLSAYGAATFQLLDAEATAFVPVGAGDEQLGFLVFIRKEVADVWRPDEHALLAMTAQMLLHSTRHRVQLGDIMQTQEALREANAQLKELSRSDPLTGLPNRRHFDEVKNIEFSRAQRSGQPLSVLMCDIDFFKRYNDTYGHAQGDECLRLVASAMRGSIARAGDLVARLGGEEFAVLLPATDRAMAHLLAERLRQAVYDLAISHSGSSVASVVTLSIGSATFEAGASTTFHELLELADRSLYQAKGDGRNRVVSATLKD
jgi:diguanylate cyclase (GGDEF)-like protein